MDDIAKEARDALQMSYEFDRENRLLAVEDFKFAAGFQWGDAAKIDRAGRPMITINRSSQFVRQVSNPIRQNMPIIKVEPDRDDQSDMAEIANGMLRRIQYNSSASHIYANAVEHMVICGIGYFRVVHDYIDQDGFDQEVLIKRIFNPLSVYPDPSAMEPARDSMGWCLVSELLPLKTFKERYPGKATTGLEQSDSASAISWGSADYVRIAEYWRRREVKKTIALLRDGSVHEMTDNGSRQSRDLIGSGLIVSTRDITSHKVEMIKVSGAEQLEETYECPSRWIPIVPVIGTEIPLDKSIYRHGLLRFQREPQQLHNYFMSVAAETLGQQPKSPYLVTPEQIKNYKSLWDNASKTPTPYLMYNPDSRVPGGKPERVAPPPVPTGLIQMAQMLSDDMKATTGIYDASLGARSNETSGIAISQRTEQGNQATFHFIDNLEHSLEHAGRIILDMIPNVYDAERTLRLVGEDDTESTVTINKPLFRFGETEFKHNDVRDMKFQSVRVVLGPNYASRRVEAVKMLTQLVQAFPNVGAVGADIIVKNMDFDGAEQLAERLRAILPPQVLQTENGGDQQAAPPPADPMADAQAQHALRLMEAEGQKAEAEASKAATVAQSESQKQQISMEQAIEQLIGTQLDNAMKQKQLMETDEALGRDDAEDKEESANSKQMLQMMGELLSRITAPKRVVFDEHGRPTGIETVTETAE